MNPTCISADPKYDINDVLNQILKSRCYESDYVNITKRLLYEDVGYDKAITVIEEIIESKGFIGWR